MPPAEDAPLAYADPRYAASCAALGRPRELPRSGARLLERAVPGADATDLRGPYPLLDCRDWSGLEADLAALGPAGPVSLVCVPTPFAPLDEAALRRAFPDLCRPFKRHLAVDLAADPEASISRHHRRQVRRGLREVEVEVAADPRARLDEWTRLYGVLVARHGIVGPAAFGRDAFALQLALPGATLLRAVRDGEAVGATLWLVRDEVAYYHLGAYAEAGYRLRASYALFALALEHFAGRARWLALGAGAGEGEGSEGLDRFKRGWANAERTAWLCGRILDRRRYAELAAGGSGETGWFPAYRRGDG